MAKEKPTILVILGVTGDLAGKKILPALFSLYAENLLPREFHLLGFGRREFSQSEFKKFVKEKIQERVSSAASGQVQEFLKLVEYEQGFFESQESYKQLSARLSRIESKYGGKANRLYYLSIPPKLYPTIFHNIRDAKLAGKGIDNRILIEKPFGHDLKSAKELDLLLEEIVPETNIYRLDHYLAKPMLENILSIRFANSQFTPIWNNKYISKIELRVWETAGVEHRGPFYDSLGALKDMGQNHLMIMLALITMHEPKKLTPNLIQKERARILNTLKILSTKEMRQSTFRAQYNGYREISGVKNDSGKETYYKLKADLSDPTWRGVPIFMESGKRMMEDRTDIILNFKDGNKLSISVEPEEGIFYEFNSHKKNLLPGLEKRKMEFYFRNLSEKVQYIEEYKRLLYKCIRGDQSAFVSEAEVEAMWKFIDPIVSAWRNNLIPLETYQPDTDQAVIKSQKIGK